MAARIGAAEFVPQYLTAWLFKGFMRDVAVYDYPLEIQRIEAHHRVGQNLDDSRLSQRERVRQHVDNGWYGDCGDLE